MTEIRAAFITAEMAPFAKAGGLADVAGALPAALARLGVKITLLLPLYGEIDREQHDLIPVNGCQSLSVGNDRYGVTASLYRAASDVEGLELLFIEQERYFERIGIYTDPTSGEPWPDEDERFFFFQEASLAALSALDLKPHLLHINDYHTALIPFLLRERAEQYGLDRDTKTLLTIHNLGYQGLYPPSSTHLIDLDEEWLAPMSPLEFHGKMNVLKAGIHFADHVNTVSPRYAGEIKTSEQGFGLEGVLQEHSGKLTGILNGIDVELWNPATDEHLVTHYSADDPAGKETVKEALCREVGLEFGSAPLAGIVSRLVHQKGFDLLLAGMERMLSIGLQLVVLGTGERKYEKALKAAAIRHPGQLAVVTSFDNGLAHRIEAGADMFLMPSRYEPCGLNQLYSLRYGTIPVVFDTGGLHDTVTEWEPESSSGTGFLFDDFTAEAMLAAIERAVKLYWQKSEWGQLMHNAMREDHSWKRSAATYKELYHKIVKGQ